MTVEMGNIIENQLNILFTVSDLRSTSIYEEINRQIEKWTKIVYFIIAQVTPVCQIIPKFMQSLVVYVATDLGNDALELPYPEWYA